MREIKYIAIHCTASRQTTTVKQLEMLFKKKGWKKPGYHYLILPDGKIHQMLSVENVSNGVKGWNSKLINIAYIGGIDEKGKPIDNRTEAQKKSMESLLKLLRKSYPDAIIQGHRDFSPDLNHDGKITSNEWIKVCPCFDAKEEFKNI